MNSDIEIFAIGVPFLAMAFFEVLVGHFILLWRSRLRYGRYWGEMHEASKYIRPFLLHYALNIFRLFDFFSNGIRSVKLIFGFLSVI